jgi:hemolysin III
MCVNDTPQYTEVETAVDIALHLLALPAAIGAVAWLVLFAFAATDTDQAAAPAIYGFGLIATLTGSAAYNLTRPCRRKELLRMVDHSMIFVMIGGTAYSVGAIIHSRCRFRFHYVVWHALVVASAGLHWVAIVRLLRLPISAQQYP